MTKRADLMPPLGYPGGPCHVVQRVRDNVRNPRLKEKLEDKVEMGAPLSNPDANKVYSPEVEKGQGRVRIVITPHAQFRMDLRGVTVPEVRLSLKRMLKQFSDWKSQNDPRAERFTRVVGRRGTVEFEDTKLGLFAAWAFPDKWTANLVTVYWKGQPDPVAPGQCILAASGMPGYLTEKSYKGLPSVPGGEDVPVALPRSEIPSATPHLPGTGGNLGEPLPRHLDKVMPPRPPFKTIFADDDTVEGVDEDERDAYQRRRTMRRQRRQRGKDRLKRRQRYKRDKHRVKRKQKQYRKRYKNQLNRTRKRNKNRNRTRIKASAGGVSIPFAFGAGTEMNRLGWVTGSPAPGELTWVTESGTTGQHHWAALCNRVAFLQESDVDAVFQLVERSASVRTAAKLVEIIGGLSPKVSDKASSLRVKLQRVDKRAKQWAFKVSGGSSPHTVKMKAVPKAANISKLSASDVLVSCDCNFWRWQGPEHWAKSGGYLLGSPVGTASRPGVRDPSGKNRVCKHVAAVISVAKGYYLPTQRGKRGSVVASASRVASRHLGGQ